MAQIFGEPGRNATDEAYKRFRKFGLVAYLGLFALGVIEGYSLSGWCPIKGLSLLWIMVIDTLLLLLIILIARWGMQKMDEYDRERVTWRKGAVGEVLVAGILDDLPDEFIVIHDVTKRFGNIDHIVIGPTGIFVLDTKNWKGTVAADGKGELLINGHPIVKPTVKNMLGAVMDFQKKLVALTEREYFVQGALVFPIAYVEAPYGSTRQIHCLRDERLLEYLQNKTFSKNLSPEDIERIKRATLQLAGMDEGFAKNTQQV